MTLKELCARSKVRSIEDWDRSLKAGDLVSIEQYKREQAQVAKEMWEEVKRKRIVEKAL